MEFQTPVILVLEFSVFLVKSILCYTLFSAVKLRIKITHLILSLITANVILFIKLFYEISILISLTQNYD